MLKLDFFAIDCVGTEASAFTAVLTIGNDGDIGAGSAAGVPNVPGLVAIDVVTQAPWPSQPPSGATIDPARRQGGINSGALGANVAVSGTKMGTMTLNTVGVAPGTYQLVFSGSSFAGGSTDVCGDHGIVQTLTVTAIPEPSSAMALSIMGVLLVGRSWYSQRSRSFEQCN